MRIAHIDLFNLKRVGDIDLDRKRIGLYHRPSRGITKVRLFTEENKFIYRDLNNMILSDVKINYDDKIYIDGKLYYNFESDIHVKIRRT